MTDKAGTADGQPARTPSEGDDREVQQSPTTARHLRASGDNKSKNVFAGHKLTLATLKQSKSPIRGADVDAKIKVNYSQRVVAQPLSPSSENKVEDAAARIQGIDDRIHSITKRRQRLNAFRPDSVDLVPRRRQRPNANESSLTLLTILSMLCDSKCQGNKDQGRLLFEYMCKQLTAYGVPVMENVFGHETLSSIRRQFYTGFDSLIMNFVRTNFGCLPDNSESSAAFANIKKLFSSSNSLLPLDLPITYYLNTRRYTTDFEEIECLGSGGFGKVYKVRHKFDTRSYAVKKIPIMFQGYEDLKTVQREVQLIANMQHPNIVAYSSSWYETYECVACSKSTSPSICSPSESGGGDCTDVCAPCFQQSTDRSDISESVQYRTRIGTSRTEEEDVVERTEAFHLISNKRITIKHYSHATAEHTYDRTASILNNVWADSKKKTGFPLILYIQMELCTETLEQFLERRNRDIMDCDVLCSIVSGQCENIFYQILSGVEYIHSKGVMHRDLKPSNIFINDVDGLTVKIGDFGLARPDWSCTIAELGRNDEPLTPMDAYAGLMTADVGTKSYAAPEQLKGTEYDQKADMYSLGIIGLEIFFPMKTTSERARVNRDLREKCGHTEPVDRVHLKWPFEAKVIQSLLSTDPSMRPTAKSILTARPVKSDKDIIWELRGLLRAKDEMIVKQAKIIEKNKKRIYKLRNLLTRTQQQLRAAEAKAD